MEIEKSARLMVMMTPKSAFSQDEIKAIKEEFKSVGVTLIILAQNNNTPRFPEFKEL
jgi:hypothetical protein